MEYMQVTLDQWMDMKEQIKKDLIGVSESFVRIGYLLRKIEEEELYKQDGYKSIAEFAKAEYGLESSTVSRFININKKYSLDGNSDRLKPEFASLGSSKLGEMLSLPDSDLTMIEPAMTREGIRELKAFNKSTPEGRQDLLLIGLIEQFFEMNQEILNDLYSSEAMEVGDLDEMIEIVNPSGNRTFRKGFYMMMLYKDDIKVKKYGSEPFALSWVEFFSYTRDIFEESQAGDKTYQKHFGIEEEEKIAPAQSDEDIGSPICEETFKAVKKEEKNPQKEVKNVDKLEEKEEIEVVPEVKVEIEDIEKAKEAAKKEIVKAEIEENPNYTREEERKIAPAQSGADIGSPICESTLEEEKFVKREEMEAKVWILLTEVGQQARGKRWEIVKKNLTTIQEMVERIIDEDGRM